MQNSTEQPLPTSWVDKIFLNLHGRFGNVFSDKFRIGELDANGKDIGVENAKNVWSHELAGVSPERIKAALSANYEYAPSCDDFKMKCVVKVIHQNYKALPAPNNKEVNKEYADNVVEFINKNDKPKSEKRAWISRILNNPSAYPDISVKYAKEALAMKESA